MLSTLAWRAAWASRARMIFTSFVPSATLRFSRVFGSRSEAMRPPMRSVIVSLTTLPHTAMRLLAAASRIVSWNARTSFG